ncbi:hypothetical protein JTE90_016266 [Oedothorax gibbosus]|uniref:Chitin-binding type-2 domain-containing protein n=1 Tax=Oedothorax gibbosus TaxID=931172 RepID=A0AAV6TJ18_9ARAC|nr:hypothetical protein JTE90_016266 [Oedothorax gibbosus]
MVLHQVFALIVLLLFLWYMSGSSGPGIVQPTSQRQHGNPNNSYNFSQVGDSYQYNYSGQVWTTDVPEGYHVILQEIRPKDPCYTVPDHGKVLATGHDLYGHVQKEQLLQSGPIEIDASTTSQDRKVFYFECLNKEIWKLHQCPHGSVFRGNECLPISICLDQPDGTRFPDPTNPKYYYQCTRSRLERKKCVQSWFFDYNQCQMTSFQYFCQHTAFQVLNDNTLLVCDRGRATFEMCPRGYRYFADPLSTEKPVCESNRCVGVPDGQRKSLDMKVKQGLTYTPGYVTCHNQRVQQRVECSQEWDTASIDHQLPLPLVFDMKHQECATPILCDNVHIQNSDIVVPVQEWTRQLPLWKYASLMDRVTGYTCDASSGLRTRVSAPAGFWIGRHMKMESACQDSTRTVVPVSGHSNRYYDCATKMTRVCNPHSFFNGEQCQRSSPNAFKYNSLDVYRMNALDWDFWIKPWEYVLMSQTDQELKHRCRTPYRYNQTYNICAHEDCVVYPFLSQIDFSMTLRDGSTCQYNTSTRYIEKTAPVSDDLYLYWAQRTTHDAKLVHHEPCREGQPIQSGHFMFDTTIFATCDSRQPFVFCPSPLTLGIEKVDGVFTCKPNDTLVGKSMLLPNQSQTFPLRMLKKLSSTKDTNITINANTYTLKANTSLVLDTIHTQYVSLGKLIIQTTDVAITLYYHSRNSYPPYVARFYKSGRLHEVKVDGKRIPYFVKYGFPKQFQGGYVKFETYSSAPLLPGLLPVDVNS